MSSTNEPGSSRPAVKFTLSKYKVCAAPKFNQQDIEKLKQLGADSQLDLRKTKELTYNPEYHELKEAEEREQNELRLQGKIMKKNTLTGYVETTHLSEAQFEEQRRDHHLRRQQEHPIKHNRDYKITTTDGDPDVESSAASCKVKKRLKNDDATDIEGYMGPWATREDECHVSKPNDEDAAIIAQFMAKKKTKKSQKGAGVDQQDVDPSEPQEKAQLHIKDAYDYQGRSFLKAPRDLDGINLYADQSPDGCRVPRNLAHTFRGHTKPITAIRYFPNTAHLLMSSSLDGKVKIWELYKERRCIMTYAGHKQGLKDVCFNNSGDKLLSASYDQYMKLWDTETGQCTQRFHYNKMAHVVKFNPDPAMSHLFLAGMSNKKVLCFDCRSGEIVQEYDRHLGAINSITFVDENRKFVTSSDDKTMRVWEWDIPVDVKYIADPTLHSMPAVTPSPNNKRLLCQSMDNKIQAFSCHNKFKLDTKKVFKGHMVAGYACVPDFSCDMSMVISGDAEGKIFFWSWSTSRIITSIKAHDNTCISVLWHPHERQKLVSAGWDNVIKIWE